MATGIKVEKLYYEVLRSTSNGWLVSGATTVTFAGVGGQNRGVAAAGSVAITFAPAGSGVRDIFPAGSNLLMIAPLGGENRDAVADASTAFNQFTSGQGARDVFSTADVTISLAPLCSGARDVFPAGSVAIAFTPEGVEVRDVFPAATTEFATAGLGAEVADLSADASTAIGAGDLATDIDVGTGGRVAFSLVGSASAARDMPRDATTTVSFSPSGAEVRDIYLREADSIGLADLASEAAVFVRSLSNYVKLRGDGDGLNRALGGTIVASADIGYIGSYRAGQTVPIGVRTMAYQSRPSMPDRAPTATIFDDAGDPVGTFKIPILSGGGVTGVFSLPLYLGNAFTEGRYRVVYQWSVGGYTGMRLDTFDVGPGGDPGGSVISLFAYDRPEARYVVAQLAGGLLVQGRNPRI